MTNDLKLSLTETVGIIADESAPAIQFGTIIEQVVEEPQSVAPPEETTEE